MWLQAGIAAVPGSGLMLYTELTRPGAHPQFTQLAGGLRPGDTHRLAVLEMRGQADYWRVWLDGRPVTDPLHLPGSSGRWKPIVTAESWGPDGCNGFSFRFEGVGVAKTAGGAWRRFTSGAQFLDTGHRLTERTAPPAAQRDLAAAVAPYAFDAQST